jgi:magnesium transporter
LPGLLYLSELFNLKVLDLRGRTLGRVKDAAVVPLIHSSRVDRFLVGGGQYAWLSVRHDQVERISLDGITLRDENLTPYHADEYMLRLERDLLDQQIIDAQGRKVVRVTDITFRIEGQAGNEILLVDDVDIGLRSILRRLLQGLVPRRWVRWLQRPIQPQSIPWTFCNVLEADPQRRLRLNISNHLLEQMHPADLAEIVEDLSPEDRGALISSMAAEMAAETLVEMEPDMQASIVEMLEPERAAEIVEEMSPDEAADLLQEMDEAAAGEILEEMEDAPASEVEELLEHHGESAGGMMTTEYVSIRLKGKLDEAWDAVREAEMPLDELHTLFVVDEDDKLMGTLPVAKLFVADRGESVHAMASIPAIYVMAGESRGRVVELFDKYSLLSLPVVDAGRHLRGVITADDVISLLREQ